MRKRGLSSSKQAGAAAAALQQTHTKLRPPQGSEHIPCAGRPAISCL